jgi:hypothetical protein
MHFLILVLSAVFGLLAGFFLNTVILTLLTGIAGLALFWSVLGSCKPTHGTSSGLVYFAVGVLSVTFLAFMGVGWLISCEWFLDRASNALIIDMPDLMRSFFIR